MLKVSKQQFLNLLIRACKEDNVGRVLKICQLYYQAPEPTVYLYVKAVDHLVKASGADLGELLFNAAHESTNWNIPLHESLLIETWHKVRWDTPRSLPAWVVYHKKWRNL